MANKNLYHGRSVQNLLNAILMVGVIVPPALTTYYLRSTCTNLPPPKKLSVGASGLDTGIVWLEAIFLRPKKQFLSLLGTPNARCELHTTQPFVYLNLLYFLVVDIGIYFIDIVQNSTWLIDPHWQLIPQCIAAFWFTHPISNGASHPRAIITTIFVSLWAVRLLHNYFRRERWNFGLQEDWRYSNMRKQHGVFWIVSQVFAVFGSARHVGGVDNAVDRSFA